MLFPVSRNFKKFPGTITARVALIFACALLAPVLVNAQIVITLKKDFIKQLSDRVTITTHFSVAATSAVHAQKDDGDIHVAGTAPEIGLTTVAEVMNARTERTGAVKDLQDAKGGAPIEITGAWRIWAEHGGQTEDSRRRRGSCIQLRSRPCF